MDKLDLLRSMPYLGQVCPYERTARQLLYGNYMVYYGISRGEVVIRAVVHSARNFDPAWLSRE